MKNLIIAVLIGLGAYGGLALAQNIDCSQFQQQWNQANSQLQTAEQNFNQADTDLNTCLNIQTTVNSAAYQDAVTSAAQASAGLGVMQPSNANVNW